MGGQTSTCLADFSRLNSINQILKYTLHSNWHFIVTDTASECDKSGQLFAKIHCSTKRIVGGVLWCKLKKIL